MIGDMGSRITRHPRSVASWWGNASERKSPPCAPAYTKDAGEKRLYLLDE